MPQAGNLHRALMKKWFGDEINEQGPLQFLFSHGFLEVESGVLITPVPSHTLSADERACISFLINEWDFYYLPDPNRYALDY